jgi:hypothetical protein
MRRTSLPMIAGLTAALALGVGGVAASTASTSAAPVGQHAQGHAQGHGHRHGHDGALARDLSRVDRDTQWQLADKLHLDFSTFHTEGLAVTPDHLFLSAVEILEPTVKYPSPVGGYDRTPGKGVGHLFVTDRQGHLQKDIVLGEGDMYHPGGIDTDGRHVWVPVAQYRPDSSAIVYRVDVDTLRVHRQFEVDDHVGGLVLDKTTGELVGNTWGSRRFYAWRTDGRQVDSWLNTSFFIDYQDCQYVPAGKMLCGGVTNLPQTPSAGGAGAVYELGGLALIDLRTHRTLRELPLQLWSTAGHVVTRNPLKAAATGDTLDLWAAPDNGDEGNGTEVLHYRATVPAAR